MKKSVASLPSRFINGDDATRNLMLKLIPHIADGSECKWELGL